MYPFRQVSVTADTCVMSMLDSRSHILRYQKLGGRVFIIALFGEAHTEYRRLFVAVIELVPVFVCVKYNARLRTAYAVWARVYRFQNGAFLLALVEAVKTYNAVGLYAAGVALDDREIGVGDFPDEAAVLFVRERDSPFRILNAAGSDAPVRFGDIVEPQSRVHARISRAVGLEYLIVCRVEVGDVPADVVIGGFGEAFALG